jgi:hypothetical protein
VPDPVGDAAALAETELTAMWTANVDADAHVTTGRKVDLQLDLRAAYYFDTQTGLAIPVAHTAATPELDGPKVLVGG